MSSELTFNKSNFEFLKNEVAELLQKIDKLEKENEIQNDIIEGENAENQRLKQVIEDASDRLYHIIETPDKDNVKKWMEVMPLIFYNKP